MNTNPWLHYSLLPPAMRVAYTLTLVVLGIGYMFAMLHVFGSHAGRDGNPMLSVDDLIIAYSGSKQDTRMEAAIKGPMAAMLPQEEAAMITAWVRGGATRQQYDAEIDKVMENRCIRCHDGSNPHIPNLVGYAKAMEMVQLDTGMTIFTLIRVSHIHLFGITFIFFIVSIIFSHAHMNPPWVKSVVVAIPFLAIIADIASWYLTKIYAPFAWIVLISGAMMGVCFAIEWVVSIYQMWFYKGALELNVEEDVI